MFKLLLILFGVAAIWVEGDAQTTTAVAFANPPQELRNDAGLQLHFQLALTNIGSMDKVIVERNLPGTLEKTTLIELKIQSGTDGTFRLAGGQIIHDSILSFSIGFSVEELPTQGVLVFYAVDKSGNTSPEINHIINQ